MSLLFPPSVQTTTLDSRLFFRKTAGRQVLDKSMGIKGNGFVHPVMIGDGTTRYKTSAQDVHSSGYAPENVG